METINVIAEEQVGGYTVMLEQGNDSFTVITVDPEQLASGQSFDYEEEARNFMNYKIASLKYELSHAE